MKWPWPRRRPKQTQQSAAAVSGSQPPRVLSWEWLMSEAGNRQSYTGYFCFPEANGWGPKQETLDSMEQNMFNVQPSSPIDVAQFEKVMSDEVSTLSVESEVHVYEVNVSVKRIRAFCAILSELATQFQTPVVLYLNQHRQKPDWPVRIKVQMDAEGRTIMTLEQGQWEPVWTNPICRHTTTMKGV